MASRGSLNKVLLIGNLTRDPELRYTPSGAAVCSFGIATNRVYTASDGTKREEAEFHRIVTWNKLAELCSQLLTKGRKVYIEGRLQTRSWTTPAGEARQTTEIVADDMKILDKRPAEELGELPQELPVAEPEQVAVPPVSAEATAGQVQTPDTGQTPQATKSSADDKRTRKQQKKRPAKDKATEETKVQQEESTEDLIKDLPF